MDDHELAEAMTRAAREATAACLAQGYGRSDPITRRSAFRAAQEVYRAEKGEEPRADPRQERMEAAEPALFEDEESKAG